MSVHAVCRIQYWWSVRGGDTFSFIAVHCHNPTTDPSYEKHPHNVKYYDENGRFWHRSLGKCSSLIKSGSRMSQAKIDFNLWFRIFFFKSPLNYLWLFHRVRIAYCAFDLVFVFREFSCKAALVVDHNKAAAINMRIMMSKAPYILTFMMIIADNNKPDWGIVSRHWQV